MSHPSNQIHRPERVSLLQQEPGGVLKTLTGALLHLAIRYVSTLTEGRVRRARRDGDSSAAVSWRFTLLESSLAASASPRVQVDGVDWPTSRIAMHLSLRASLITNTSLEDTHQ